MKKNTLYIDEYSIQTACQYIQRQFDTRSWWPKAQPGLAKREFNLMNRSSGALTIWCERWLDLGQLRKLERAIKTPKGAKK